LKLKFKNKIKIKHLEESTINECNKILEFLWEKWKYSDHHIFLPGEDSTFYC